MQGLLKSKSPLNQFLVLICIALVSFFVIGLAGTMIISKMTGIDMLTMGDPSKWDIKDGRYATVLRGFQLAQFIGLFLVPALICAHLFSTDRKKYLGLNMPGDGTYVVAAVGILLVAIPLVNLLGQWNQQVQFPPSIEKWLQEQEQQAARTVKFLLSRHDTKDIILNVVFIAGLAAVGEELLFRGIVQRLLIKMFKSPVAGILVTAFLFSAMHMQFYGFLPRFMLGILLGYIYWYSGSLWLAILAHFVYDALLIVIVSYNPNTMDGDADLKMSNLAVAGALSLATVVAIFIWMRKRSKTTYETVYADDAIPVKNHPF